MKNKGFTLIEILIALAVFTIIASFTASILSQILQIKEQSQEQVEKINNLQLVISLLNKDIKQILERPVRGNQLHMFPSFIGQPDYVEFTRDGHFNPLYNENRSNLIRVAYICKNQTLVRRVWDRLDSPDRDKYQDSILLDSLKKCEFAYIGMHHNIMPNWYQYTIKRDNKSITTPLPIAIQFSFNQDKIGYTKLNFMVSL